MCLVQTEAFLFSQSLCLSQLPFAFLLRLSYLFLWPLEHCCLWLPGIGIDARMRIMNKISILRLRGHWLWAWWVFLRPHCEENSPLAWRQAGMALPSPAPTRIMSLVITPYLPLGFSSMRQFWRVAFLMWLTVVSGMYFRGHGRARPSTVVLLRPVWELLRGEPCGGRRLSRSFPLRAGWLLWEAGSHLWSDLPSWEPRAALTWPGLGYQQLGSVWRWHPLGQHIITSEGNRWAGWEAEKSSGVGPCSPGPWPSEVCQDWGESTLPEPSSTGRTGEPAETLSGLVLQLGFVIKTYGKIYGLWAPSSLLYLSWLLTCLWKYAYLFVY